jgi:PAS domain S-box-containing protein
MDTIENAEQTQKDRILVVDDNKATRMFLDAMLKNAGYKVFTAATGQEALDLVPLTEPHLILLDIILPDISGFEVCRILKSNETSRSRPILFITATNEEEECIKGLRMGALDLLTKPINIKMLLTKVRTFVQLSKDEQRLKQMQAELQGNVRTLQQFSQALDNATDGVLISDHNGTIAYGNASFEELVDQSMETVKTQNIIAFVSDAAFLKKAFHNAAEGVSSKVATPLISGEKTIPVLVKCSPILDPDGHPNGLLFVFVDEREREVARQMQTRLEAELLHAQKLESVGQLASGIAHEINTPTQFVGDNIRFMQDAIADLFKLQKEQENLLKAARKSNIDPAITARVEQALEEADVDYLCEELPNAIEQSLEGISRVATIVRAMKNFAHPGKTEKAPADLNDAIRTTTTVAHNKWKYVAELELNLDENLPSVPCLVSEFNQVVLNLIVNASDAIGDRFAGKDQLGKIIISTSYNADHARVEVHDNGGGIPEKIRPRIFDPFFTTKEVGKGSGQGLAIAHSVIVTKHQGKLHVETEEGESTSFVIQLPL